jgi:hypothetical protein
MKNIHVLPTDILKIDRKTQTLWTNSIGQFLHTHSSSENLIPYNIFITSDEEIEEGNWRFDLKDNDFYKTTISELGEIHNCKKIILTTDLDLIKNGIQAIDDNFLQWFVKNPSCEWVEVEEVYPLNCCIKKEGKTKMNNGCMERNRCLNYKIIIPK